MKVEEIKTAYDYKGHACVCVRLAFPGAAVDFRAPGGEGGGRSGRRQRGKARTGRLRGVPSHCDVVPSALQDTKTERLNVHLRPNQQPVGFKPMLLWRLTPMP